MESIFTTSGNSRWDLFVRLNDEARETLALADAVAAGLAYRAWYLDEDQPYQALTPWQLRLWRHVVEWAEALKRGVPDASFELCVARARYVRSFVSKEERHAKGQGERAKETGSTRQGHQAAGQIGASVETY